MASSDRHLAPAIRAKAVASLMPEEARLRNRKPSRPFPKRQIDSGRCGHGEQESDCGPSQAAQGLGEESRRQGHRQQARQAEGVADKIAGKMQKAYGDIKDKLRKVI